MEPKISYHQNLNIKVNRFLILIYLSQLGGDPKLGESQGGLGSPKLARKVWLDTIWWIRMPT